MSDDNNQLISKSGNFKKGYQWRIWKIIAELVNGFELISEFDFNKTITVWGSARIGKKEKVYEKIEKFGKLAVENGYIIVTGGGGGIMEAANKGAFQANGKSIGLNIKLPREQVLNEYVTSSVEFRYFFVRKMMLSFISRHYLFAPGGFGTFDELFEILTLAQTKKIGRKVNIILIDKKFWQPILKQIEEVMIKKYKTISREDLNIIQLIDTAEEAMNIIINSNKKLNS